MLKPLKFRIKESLQDTGNGAQSSDNTYGSKRIKKQTT